MQKKIIRVLAVVLVIGVSSFMMAGACDDVASVAEGACGPCGKVSTGDTTITGMAQLDGIFKAVGTLKASTGSIQANFDGHVRTIATSVLGIEGVAEMSTDEVVAAIEASFQGWIEANVEGGIKVAYQPPKCEANVNVAVSAQAECEVKGGCSADVKCDPGKASFECSGKCEGSCEGTCTVPSCSVTVTPGEANCSGSCEGSCTATLDVAAECSGKCEGTCSGECSAYDGQGNCAGACDGNCQGSCTVEGSAAVECSGSCSGSCKLEGPEAEASCEGDLGCSGSCEGSCSGGCEGEIKAPSCEGKAECDASADCEAQASAQASASVECTPPSLKLDVAFAANADAGAKADFLAKLELFKVEMMGILQGWAQMRALVDADYAASIGIDPPTVAIQGAIEGFVDALGKGEIEIEAPGLALCAIPAFEEAGQILGSIAGEVSGTIEGQVKMAGLISL